MRPIFTIHAGEIVFAEALQKRVSDVDLWIPAKDKGIDFLVTKPNRDKPISVQVKMSRDYRPEAATTSFEKGQLAGGWFTFNHKKIETSKADIWSLILVSRERSFKPFFINIPPHILLERLVKTFGVQKTYQSYPWVLNFGKKKTVLCVEGRGLSKKDKENLAKENQLDTKDRDLTEFYENWSAFR